MAGNGEEQDFNLRGLVKENQLANMPPKFQPTRG